MTQEHDTAIDYNLIKGFLGGIRPELRMSTKDWSNEYRYLPAVASYESGKYRSSRTPYLEKIMEVMSPHSPVREIIFKKCSQIGGTEILNNWIGSIIHMAPGGILMVSPTDNLAKRNSKIRIEPMIQSTPPLRERVMSAKVRDGGNTVYQKDFPNGFLVMCGANSPADLKSLPCRYIGLDEINEYPADLDGQGSVIELAKARARNFPNSKLYINSSPTLEDGIIDKEFEDTDQQYYHVPCPHCAATQKLVFTQLRWEKGDYDHVYYQCEHCNQAIDERFKMEMLRHGDWVAECPEKVDKQRMGFAINALYSPWYGWGEICRTYDKAQHSEPKMRTFVNTILGEAWKEKGEQPDYNMVYNKRVDTYKPNFPPAEVCFITAGVDVQKDRLEVEIVGWAKGKRSYSIDYRVLVGDTSDDKVWDELAKVVNEVWTRAGDGLMLPLRKMCVDTGYNQSKAIEFCRRFDLSRVVPVRGDDRQGVIIGAPKLVDYNRDGKKIGSIRAWHVGVSILKSELYGWLRLNKDDHGHAPPGYCFFPKEGHYSGVDFFKGLCGEQLEVRKDNRGVQKYVWVKKHHFNEPLDCRNYARAAAAIVGIDRFRDLHYDAIAGQVVKKKVEKKTKRPEDDWL